MTSTSDNIIQFPLDRRRSIRCCPHCGTQSNVWKIGRLLWGYCRVHELRWVVADFKHVTPQSLDRRQLRHGLEFLSAYAEVSH